MVATGQTCTGSSCTGSNASAVASASGTGGRALVASAVDEELQLASALALQNFRWLECTRAVEDCFLWHGFGLAVFCTDKQKECVNLR